MVKATVYLEPESAVTLRQLSRSEGKSQAALLREALSFYIQRLRRPEPTGIGGFHSGRSDVSTRAEELLKEAARDRR
ncbi:MAG: ribbon-helix-helix protein, CopG family [bacterium]|nr:ribbon-helix-helix protein, CopG family [bacterium]